MIPSLDITNVKRSYYNSLFTKTAVKFHEYALTDKHNAESCAKSTNQPKIYGDGRFTSFHCMKFAVFAILGAFRARARALVFFYFSV